MNIPKSIIKRYLVILLLLISTVGFSQEELFIKKRIKLDIGYTPIKTGTINSEGSTKNQYVGNYNMSINYGILNYLELGAYLGYSKFETYSLPSQEFSTTYSNTPFYGVSVRLQLLPLFMKSRSFRFDVYAIGKLGGYYISVPDNYIMETGRETEYNIGIGVSYYIWEQFGVFTDYSLGVNIYDANKLNFGLSYKW